MIHLEKYRYRYLDIALGSLSLGLAIQLISNNADLDALVLLYFCIHLMITVLFLIRRPPLMHSPIRQGHLVAGLSTIYVYCYELSSPLESSLSCIGKVITEVGALFSLLSLISLGKCFGVYPACRGLVTSSPYHIIRHPLYASYIVMDLGLVISYPSPSNAVLFFLGILLFTLRMHYEELLLEKFSEYRTYRDSVKFKLVPFVY